MNVCEGILETANNKTQCNQMQVLYGCWTRQRERGWTHYLIEQLDNWISFLLRKPASKVYVSQIKRKKRNWKSRGF